MRYRYGEMHATGWTGREQPVTCGLCRKPRRVIPSEYAPPAPESLEAPWLLCERCDTRGGPTP